MTFSSKEIREEYLNATKSVPAGNNGKLPKSMCKGFEFSEITPLNKGRGNFVIKKEFGIILKKRIKDAPVEVMKEQIEKITE